MRMCETWLKKVLRVNSLYWLKHVNHSIVDITHCLHFMRDGTRRPFIFHLLVREIMVILYYVSCMLHLP